METKEAIRELRVRSGMTQDELAERLHVTRQAVSRWETGKTVPDTALLAAIAAAFSVSVDRVLGLRQDAVCQCCGMPLDGATVSTEPGGGINDEFCRWCYADGQFTYSDMDSLIAFVVEHFATPDCPPEQMRAYMQEKLPQLRYWAGKARVDTE